MKLIVVGATGNTGLQLVQQALARGHEVTAVVRDPAKLAHISHQNFKTEKADLVNPDELAKAFEGKEAVLSALGVAGVLMSRTTFYQDSMKSIVEAMRKNGIKRLLCVTSFYSDPNQKTYPFSYKIILRPMIGRQLDSMHEMETYLFNEAVKDIDFTIVRPPRLLDAELIDLPVSVNKDAFHFQDGSTRNQVPRANVAKFMLDELEQNAYIKVGVAIDLPK